MSILTMATALSQARTLLNDDVAGQFPDPVLIPKIQIAHYELQTALWNAGSPTIRKISVGLPILAGQTSLFASGGMPADLLTPFKLAESASSTGPWIPMTEVFFISDLQIQIPPQVPGTLLVWWSWTSEDIQFLSATTNRFVQIVYRRGLAIPNASSDSLGMTFAEAYLAPRAAALADASLGGKRLDSLTAMATKSLAEVIEAHRGKQVPPVKP